MADDRWLAPWFHRPRPIPVPRARLVCFPHGGGTAGFFRGWPALVGDDVEVLPVQYPGREERLGDPVAERLSELADLISAALMPFLTVPTALFGHSFGAVLAYEVAVRLSRYRAVPSGLVVSGHPGPGLERPTAWHLATDAELCAELLRVGGMREEVLNHAELLRLVLPVIRADYRLSETHRMTPLALDCPVLACIGADDSEVTAEEVGAWAAVTSVGYGLRVFPGGHFYLTACRRELTGEVTRFAFPPSAVSSSPGSARNR
jgi:pyochelin biosynthetic protein PchC